MIYLFKRTLLFSSLFCFFVAFPLISLEQSPRSVYLEKKLEELKISKENLTVESEEFMLADWSKYGKDIEKIKKLDQEIKKLEKELLLIENSSPKKIFFHVF